VIFHCRQRQPPNTPIPPPLPARAGNKRRYAAFHTGAEMFATRHSYAEHCSCMANIRASQFSSRPSPENVAIENSYCSI
jgi:hypothetical protein